MLTASFFFQGLSFAAEKIAPTGVVFTDGGAAEFSLVRYGDEIKSQYLVKISGVDNIANDKVQLVNKSGGGTGATYYEKVDGGNLMRAPAHEYFNWEAYLGGKTYKINQDLKKTKALKTLVILNDYLMQQNK